MLPAPQEGLPRCFAGPRSEDKRRRKNPAYNYQMYTLAQARVSKPTNNFIYCCDDCFSVLMLRKQNNEDLENLEQKINKSFEYMNNINKSLNI